MKDSRSSMTAREDNVTMLTKVHHFKGRTLQLAIIAREIALVCARPACEPVVVEHVPGVANVFADQLRRLHDLHKHLTVPDTFRFLPQAIPEHRSQLWYHALDVPCNDRLAAHGGEN